VTTAATIHIPDNLTAWENAVLYLAAASRAAWGLVA